VLLRLKEQAEALDGIGLGSFDAAVLLRLEQIVARGRIASMSGVLLGRHQ
jgi:hypothetical protein